MAVDEVARGDVVVSPALGRCDRRICSTPSSSSAADEPEHGDRVQVHHGTREAPARLAWLGGRFWQLRLEQPLVAAGGDRLVVRQIAPPDTLGGGRVLDPRPRKHGPGARPARPPRAPGARGAGGAAVHGARARGRAEPEPAQAPEPQPLLGARRSRSSERLREAGFEPPLDSELDAADLAALREAGRAVRVTSRCTTTPTCWRTCAGG